MKYTFLLLAACLLASHITVQVASQDAVPEQCDCSLAEQVAADKAVKDAASQVGKLKESCNQASEALHAQIQELESASKSCQAKAETSTKTIVELKMEVAHKTQLADHLKGELAEAEKKLKAAEAKAAKLSASTSASGDLRRELDFAMAKLAALEADWLPVPAKKLIAKATIVVIEQTEKAKVMYAEFTAGETGQKVNKVLLEARAKALELWAEAEPKVVATITLVKEKVQSAVAEGKVHYQKHVAGSDWAGKLHRQYEELNKELSSFITTQLRHGPEATRKFADPVTVQYAVWTILALPLAMFLYVAAALTCGRKPTPAAARPGAGGRGPKRNKV